LVPTTVGARHNCGLCFCDGQLRYAAVALGLLLEPLLVETEVARPLGAVVQVVVVLEAEARPPCPGPDGGRARKWRLIAKKVAGVEVVVVLEIRFL
jgi:hypothetical protein